MNNFKDKTETGFDKLSVKLLKYITSYIVDPYILYKSNLFLKQGIFPNKLKQGIFKLLY